MTNEIMFQEAQDFKHVFEGDINPIRTNGPLRKSHVLVKALKASWH